MPFTPVLSIPETLQILQRATPAPSTEQSEEESMSTPTVERPYYAINSEADAPIGVKAPVRLRHVLHPDSFYFECDFPGRVSVNEELDNRYLNSKQQAKRKELIKEDKARLEALSRKVGAVASVPTTAVDDNDEGDEDDEPPLEWEDQTAEAPKETPVPMSREDIACGKYCLVRYSGDDLNFGGYRRAVVVHYDPRELDVLVRLIDIGSTLNLNIQENGSKLYVIPDDLLKYKREVFLLRTTTHVWQPLLDTDEWRRLLNMLEKDPQYLIYITHVKVASTPKSSPSSATDSTSSTSVQTPYRGDDYEFHFRTRYWGIVVDCNLDECLSDWAVKNKIGTQNSWNMFSETKMEKFRIVDKSPLETKPTLPISRPVPIRVCKGSLGYQNFYVTKVDHQRDQIEQTLANFFRFGQPVVYTPWHTLKEYWGNICCVKYPNQPTVWCRGRVLLMDKNWNSLVLLIDRGEIVYYKWDEVYRFPVFGEDSVLLKTPPFAYHCTLPVKTTLPDVSDVLARFADINNMVAKSEHNKVVVLDINNGTHTVDIEITQEAVSLCEALVAVGEAEFQCDNIVKGKVEREFYKRTKPKFISNSVLEYKANKYGYHFGEEETKDSFNEKRESVNLSPEEKAKLPLHSVSRLSIPSIDDLIGKTCQFNHHTILNSLAIMDKENGLRIIKELESSISQWIETGKGKFEQNEWPIQNDVVLCPAAPGKPFRRGVVQLANPKTVVVRLLEYCDTKEYLLKDLRKVNDSIMEFPRVIHFVKLNGVDDDIPILFQQFRDLRSKMNASAILSKVVTHAKGSQLAIVEMRSVDDRQSLSILLNNAAIWKWRKYFRALYRSLQQIVQAEGGTFPTKEEYFSTCTITKTLKRKRFVARVQYRVTPEQDFTLVFCIPNLCDIAYNSRTVQVQMQHFIAKVENPVMTQEQIRTYTHMMSASIKETRGTLNTENSLDFSSLCVSHRCFFSNACGDNGELYCIDCCWRSGKLENYEVRKLSPDFYEACPSSIVLRVAMKNGVRAQQFGRELLPRGRQLEVELTTGEPQVSEDLVYYDAVLPEVESQQELQ